MSHGHKCLAYTGRKNQSRALTSDFLSGTSFILSCNLLLFKWTSRSSHLSRNARRFPSWSFIAECQDSPYQHPSTLQSTHYCAFHKHANSKVQKPPSQVRFSLPSIIVMITSNEPGNTETHKTDRNSPITITNLELLNPLK